MSNRLDILPPVFISLAVGATQVKGSADTLSLLPRTKRCLLLGVRLPTRREKSRVGGVLQLARDDVSRQQECRITAHEISRKACSTGFPMIVLLAIKVAPDSRRIIPRSWRSRTDGTKPTSTKIAPARIEPGRDRRWSKTRSDRSVVLIRR